MKVSLLAAMFLALALISCDSGGSTQNEAEEETLSPEPQAVWDQGQWDQKEWT